MTISDEEHVARAIQTADEQNGGAPYELVIQNKHSKEALFDRARAAIAAMREREEAAEHPLLQEYPLECGLHNLAFPESDEGKP